ASWVDVATLRDHLRLEQRLSDWHLIARHPDPNVAAIMADAWAESALVGLDEAFTHAVRAAAMQGGLLDVQCLAAAGSAAEEEIPRCLTPVAAVREDQVDQFIEEIRAAHGILPSLSYELARRAEVPGKPVVGDQGLLTLAGALVGVLVGTALLSSFRPRESASSSHPSP
ncbi:MAG: hypothetical protein AAB254_05915, partial [candidate division NC10 bacterium]